MAVARSPNRLLQTPFRISSDDGLVLPYGKPLLETKLIKFYVLERLQQIQIYQAIFWRLLFIVKIAYGRPPE